MNICIVEDHVLVAQLLKSMLHDDEEAYTIKLFKSAEELLEADFSQWTPDIFLLDISLPGMNGLELIDEIKARQIGGKVIILTSIMDMNTVTRAMEKGINGYLTKDLSKEEFVEAIHQVFQGGRYINKSLKEKIVDHQFNLAQKPVNFNLSQREKEVLQLICDGATPKEIAYTMNLSLHTIHHYLRNMMSKLKVNRTTDLVIFAAKYDLCRPTKS